MPHHYWGDDWEHWNLLYKAQNEFCDKMRLARIGCHGKEKYGTFRCSIYLFNGSMYSLTHPGYVGIFYPMWLYKLDRAILQKINNFCGVTKLVRNLQIWWLRKTCLTIIEKYSIIKDEMFADVDFHALVPEVGEIHKKYWRRYGETNKKEKKS